MRDLIETVKQEIKAARAAGDIPVLLASANSAISRLETASQTPDLPWDEQKVLLSTAKNIAYNCAADVWPGWDLNPPARSDAALQAGQAIAWKCKALTDRLEQTAVQRGNAFWLIGAFDLARCRYGDAVTQFKSAAAAFEGEPEAVLMAQGFWALAAGLSGARADRAPKFDMVIDKLKQLATEDADWFEKQLQVSRQLFGSNP